MKNFEIVDITNSYLKLKNSDKVSMSLPIVVSWKRRVNLKKLLKIRDTIFEAVSELDKLYFDEDHSTELTDSDGKKIKDANGENLRAVKEEFREEYVTKKKELFDAETDVEIKKVKLEDLKDVTLSDDEMNTLMFMIEEEE